MGLVACGLRHMADCLCRLCSVLYFVGSIFLGESMYVAMRWRTSEPLLSKDMRVDMRTDIRIALRLAYVTYRWRVLAEAVVLSTSTSIPTQ